MRALIIFISLFTFCSIDTLAQEGEYREGIEARLYHSLKLSKNFTLKSTIIGREGFLTVFKIPELSSSPQRADFQTALERKIRDRYKVAAGSMYRITELQNALRVFQQLGWAQKVNSRLDKLAHRFRIDETFSDNVTEIRLRYRMAFESPLKGYRLDIEESYFTFSFEALQKFKENERSREIRLNPRIGRFLKNRNKAEIGIDFRYSKPFSDNEVKLFLLQFRYYLVK